MFIPYVGVLHAVSCPKIGGVLMRPGCENVPVPLLPYFVQHHVYAYLISSDITCIYTMYRLRCIEMHLYHLLVYLTPCHVPKQVGHGCDPTFRTQPCLTPEECNSLLNDSTLSHATMHLFIPYLGVFETVSCPKTGGVWTRPGCEDAPVPLLGVLPYFV